MSLQSVTSRHRAMKLNLVETRGTQLGSKHAWEVTSTELTCTIVPATGSEETQLRQRGARLPHVAYFSSDPGLDERNGLRWENVGNRTFLRVLSPARNVHGQNRLWIVPCDVSTHDQVSQEVV